MELATYERGMNPEQLEVIRHEGGPLVVLAQAGSGKTASLTRRVARLIEQGVVADRIFCVTFSRKAADEMDARLRHMGVGGASVKTWHAFCYRVLREDQTPQGRWTLDEKDRAKIFVKKAMGHEHANWVGGDLTKVRNYIGQCKANLFEPDSGGASELAGRMFGPSASRAIQVFSISQQLIEDAQLLTFDDMLVFCHRHFLDEERRLAWAGRFDYVMQDEAQDANAAQCAIAEQLAREHRNYMVVGDVAQSIFGFRGSTPKFLAEFQERWGAKRVAMCRNYRSGREIINVANEVIRPAAYRQPEDMIASREPLLDGKVEVVSANTLEDEAGELVSFVQLHREAGRKLSEMVVLFRLNAQSRSLEEALLKAKIPYQIVGGTNFYERKEVKDLLAYLRVAANRDQDGDAVKRCINAPFRFLGARFVEKVMELAARDKNAGWDDLVQQAARSAGIQRRQFDSALQWVGIIQGAMKMIPDQATAYEVLNSIVVRTAYINWLEKEEGEESIESSHAANVRELLRVAQQFPTVAELLDFVDLNVKESAKQRRQRGENVVTLMSIHRSKGLEWPIVWVVGCNETILPHAKGDPEEERRLAYVAFTRARDHLVASHVTEMATRVGLKTLDRSQYLDAFPAPANVVPSVEPPPPDGELQAFHAVLEPPTEYSTVLEDEVGNPGSLRGWMGDATCAECGQPVAGCGCVKEVSA